ncbi:UPF0575 protein C19orf67 homolog [Pelodytes ibericus]
MSEAGSLHPEGPASEEQREEKMLSPLINILQYLKRKGEELQMYLIYRQDFVRKEQFSLVLPTLIRVCQPFLLYLESAGRDSRQKISTPSDSLQIRLLDISQQLVKQLEHLSLMYGSFGFISLDDTDPKGFACALCGRFFLGHNLRVSIFRYFIPAPYSCSHRKLYKKLRWNVEITEETAGGRETSIKYYFLCYKETALNPSQSLALSQDKPPPSQAHLHLQKFWSIGLWVPLEPANDGDLMSWILCYQPSAYYHQLLTVGFHEPSHTVATDLLVQILTKSVVEGMTTPAQLEPRATTPHDMEQTLLNEATG